jgi:S1-C subfamily serine protease
VTYQGSWQGSDAGMPPPPGWQPQPPGGPEQGPRRWPALLAAMVLASTIALGSWAAISLSSEPVRTQGGTTSVGSHPPTAIATAGIVAVNTFGKSLGSGSSQLFPQGAGTGMVLTSDGEVLTNNHVVQGAWKIEADVPGGQTYTATVVGVDPAHDVALLQLADASGMTTVSTGESSSVTIGDDVSGVGNALGRQGPPSVATGSVTGLNRTITARDPHGTAEKLTGMIQTDANILPGDSGGALVNGDGEVIGMITAGNSQNASSSANTTGFAIPIDTALEVVDQIHAGGGGTVLMGDRGYLGVGVQQLDPTSASRFGVDSGALVTGLDPGGPAERAGMTAPAVIRSVDGHAVTSFDSLGPLLHSHTPGQNAVVSWVDASGSHTATIELTTGPAV